MLSFCRYLKSNNEIEDIGINSFKFFLKILINNFINRIQPLYNKDFIYEEYNIFIEIVTFLGERNRENAPFQIRFIRYNYYPFSIIYLVNQMMNIILEKIPEKYINSAKFFKKYCEISIIFSR